MSTAKRTPANDSVHVAAQALPRTLCNDVTTLTRAVTALRSCSYIVCDCEGTNLGSLGGRLSLIILCGIPIADSEQPHIYLIDTVVLKRRILQPVFELLRSDQHTKVMYDPRMDWSELFHRHNVELSQVLDLQLADVASRSVRGEREGGQLARLFTFCGEDNVKSHRQSYTKVHRLNSLESCATEHNVVNGSKKIKSRKRTI